MNKEDLTLHSVSHDIILHIFGYLDVSDLITTQRVCRLFYELIKSNQIWKPLFTRDFTTVIFDISYCCSIDIINDQSCWMEKFKKATLSNTKEKELYIQSVLSSYLIIVSAEPTPLILGKEPFSIVNETNGLVSSASYNIALSKLGTFWKYSYQAEYKRQESNPFQDKILVEEAKHKFDEAKKLVKLMTFEERCLFSKLQSHNVHVNNVTDLKFKDHYHE